ncbi:unnamed protein product, partial [Adineta steineri]
HKVRTPTHMVTGENDCRVPTAQSYLLKRALHILGIPSKLIVFPGEGHLIKNNPWHEKIKTFTVLTAFNCPLSDLGVLHIVNALQQNKTLNTLVLGYNQFGPQGAHYLANDLKRNTVSSSHNLYIFRSLSLQGVQHLANALETNNTLITLALNDNEIGDLGAQYLANILEQNTTLSSLDLSSNEIGDDGIAHLANALKQNKTLTTLFLGCIMIGSQGVHDLADALKQNEGLNALNIYRNHINNQGAQYIANALQQNQTLISLDMRYNDIDVQGAEYFVNALQVNKVTASLVVSFHL